MINCVEQTLLGERFLLTRALRMGRVRRFHAITTLFLFRDFGWHNKNGAALRTAPESVNHGWDCRLPMEMIAADSLHPACNDIIATAPKGSSAKLGAGVGFEPTTFWL